MDPRFGRLQTEDPGLKPLVVDDPMHGGHPMLLEPKPYKKKFRTEVSRADFCLTSGIRLTLHGCDVRTLVSMIKEMEGSLC